ncbi:hypothetical protein MSAN_01201400 [Mycena sanguinolenta]|uniref:Uncharacterized protein n=1 Tax=Mycena sanguinolenta TaxID=230812 RepID=A0A8H6YHF6_9AGAR|nr:hypothetical protein MSAN_01201400 [Mycena sanguinolenta]
MTICYLFVLAILVLGGISPFKRNIAIEEELLSRITEQTPISGFYGPGSWWAWLITLGMTHGHMGAQLLMAGKVSEEWDYDLMGASGYIIAAAIDLILKSRAIAQLGDAASESPLLPALLCAERVVSFGTGSSLFTIATGLGLIRGPSGRRRAGIAAIPLCFAFVASWFALRAHQAIFRTTPVIWCRLHDGKPRYQEFNPTNGADFLGSLIEMMRTILSIYTSRIYWVLVGIVGAMTTVVALLETEKSAAFRLIAFAIGVLPSAALLPLITAGILLVLWIFTWAGLWVLLWILLYVFALFPRMGWFPLTKISVTDMDQLAGLLGVGFIAAFRSGERIFKAL